MLFSDPLDVYCLLLIPPPVTGTPVTPVVAFVQRDVGPLLPKLVLSPDEVCTCARERDFLRMG